MDKLGAFWAMLWPLLLLGAWDRLLLSACGAGRWAAPLAGLGAGLLLVALLRAWSEQTQERGHPIQSESK